jgi:epoxyqueuosine reductase
MAAPATLRDQLRARALAEGFDAFGIAPARAAPELASRLTEFLNRGFHGEMGWMETRSAERADPCTLWPDAKSAIVLGLNYGPDHDPLPKLERKDEGVISVYAQGGDYHDVIKPRLKRIGHWLYQQTGRNVKVFVDTAPVMEKPLAARAGLGWQGKHTNLVSRELGSWLFLGVILSAAELEPDTSETDHCGSCRACLDICPTAAFSAPYQLDARRCISYLTIEHKGPIPRDLRPLMGNRIYGCDDCLAVCPWNKFAKTGTEPKLLPRENLSSPKLAELAALDDASFRALFAKSPVKRIGRARFVRNVLIAIGNCGDDFLVASAFGRLSDPEPLVRGAAVWALRRLAKADQFEMLAAQHAAHETDPDVLTEWQA